MIPVFFLLLTQQAAAQVAESPLSETNSLVWADVDGDGRLDLAAIRADGTVQLLLNAGEGRFGDATERLGLSEVTNAALLAWADYDADGRLDVFVGVREGRSRLFHNERGSFVDMSAGSGLVSTGPVREAYWLDHDGDTRLGPMLHFGGAGSGEGVLSKRTAGGNLQGLDLVTGGLPRVSITNGGNVGIGAPMPDGRSSRSAP